MASKAYPGKCRICQEETTKRTYASHFKKVHFSKVGDEQYLILVDTPSPSPFWLFLLANPNAQLTDLDIILRDIWLECCNHLSAFTIGGCEYQSESFSEDISSTKSMNVALKKVIGPGSVFSHEYDFGSTTYLRLKVIDVVNTDDADGKVTFIGRNSMPEIKCHKCGEQAGQICQDCMEGDEWVFCSSCAETHTCDEEMLIRITNSPRSGECGYDGGMYDNE